MSLAEFTVVAEKGRVRPYLQVVITGLTTEQMTPVFDTFRATFDQDSRPPYLQYPLRMDYDTSAAPEAGKHRFTVCLETPVEAKRLLGALMRAGIAIQNPESVIQDINAVGVEIRDMQDQPRSWGL